MRRTVAVLVCLTILLPAARALGEAGVIIPSNIKDTPDPDIISLADMHTRISLNNQFATVRVVQVFKNKIDQDVEGKYIFSLPEGAQVSAFAIWEDGVRIPAVIVEKQRASELYEELTAMKVDPGLMESGGPDDQNLFTVRVYPIPAHGTKRIELTYTMAMPVQSLQSQFTLPLKPSLYSEQTAGKFELEFTLKSDVPVADFTQAGSSMPLDFSSRTEREIIGSFSGEDVVFREDFSVNYALQIEQSVLSVLTHRDPRQWQDIGPLSGGARFTDKSGYFAAQAAFNQQPGAEEREPLEVVLLVDTSISMQWKKLQACYAATEYFLKNLSDEDQFTLLTFNETVSAWSPELKAATRENTSAALQFFERSYLRGGTDLAGALEGALSIAAQAGDGTFVVAITDGAPSMGEVQSNAVSRQTAAAGSTGKLMIFGIGNDARIDLLQRLASENNGHFVWATESENLEFKLARFFESLSEPLINNLKFSAEGDALTAVYMDTTTSVFDRSNVNWLGRYLESGETTVTVNGAVDGDSFELSQAVALPEENNAHPQLPRRWAQLRVEYLERQIDKSEDPAAVEKMINEVVYLSKKYMFVTQYTSFLAAPRSLLRPRAMKAGDPILRVKTVAGINAVVAHFPFGLTKPLHYSPEEDVWETRFLAPASMSDGRYHVDLYLTDEDGTVYSEQKEFTVDSKPPSLKLELESGKWRPGQTMELKIYADADTRSIVVRVGGLMPVSARWDDAAKANVARISLPADMPAGLHHIKISAVDFARNTAVLTEDVIVEEQ